MSSRLSEARDLSQTSMFQDLKQFIIDLTGLGYYRDKEDRLAQHVNKRVQFLGFRSPGQYLDFIRSSEGRAELDGLIDEIAIGETYFFRNPVQFDVLGQCILPDCIEARKNERSLKIWSAGCASGAEPYSIAILLERDWPEISHSWNIDLAGTDICEARLDRARRAVFTDWEMRGLPDEIRAACFKHQGKHWRLHSRYARRVSFARQNLKDLATSAPDGRSGVYDVIFCRNVLIYFDVGLMRRILAKLRDLLADGGWLLVGHAEPYFEIAHYFTPLTIGGTTVYRRLDNPDAYGRPQGLIEPNLTTERPSIPHRQAADDAAWSSVPPKAPMFPADVTPARYSPAEDIPSIDGPAPESKKPLDPLKRIRALADAARWPEACGACESYVAEHPLVPAGHFMLALIQEHRGETGAALAELKRVVYLDRGHALAHFHIGRLHIGGGDLEAALRSFSNVIDLVCGLKPGTPVQDGEGMHSDELCALARRHVERLVT